MTTLKEALRQIEHDHPTRNERVDAIIALLGLDPDGPVLHPVTDADLQEQIAVGVHTGLRKGSEAPSSASLHRAISDSIDSAWTDAARYCVWGLNRMGYKVLAP